MFDKWLVIFDCDGVVVDSELLSATVAAQVLGEHGWHVSVEELMARFVGCTDDFWRAEIGARIPEALEPDWHERHAWRYEQAFDESLRPVPGIDDVLDALEREGVDYCLASNGGHAKIRANLDRTGLLARFTGRIFSAEDVARGKPAPDLFLHAARSLGVPPARSLVVEDSPPGVAAARAAGMRCLGYTGGHVPASRLEGEGTTLVNDMSQTAELILGVARPTVAPH